MTTDHEPKISAEELYAYFDGELDPGDRIRVERAIEREPALRKVLDDLAFLDHGVGEALRAAAAEVPSARFEQVWGEIDRVLDRDARVPGSAGVSWWTRVRDLSRPLRWPAAAAAAAVVVTLLVVRVGGDDSNKGDRVASVDGPVPSEAPPMANRHTPPQDPLVAEAGPDVGRAEQLPAPESNEAEIEQIEFGGKTGRISQIEGRRGTTTVIWVTEEEPVDSERSL